jgi:hypothetical protein
VPNRNAAIVGLFPDVLRSDIHHAQPHAVACDARSRRFDGSARFALFHVGIPIASLGPDRIAVRPPACAQGTDGRACAIGQRLTRELRGEGGERRIDTLASGRRIGFDLTSTGMDALWARSRHPGIPGAKRIDSRLQRYVPWAWLSEGDMTAAARIVKGQQAMDVELAHRVVSEYREMPGLALTIPQAMRLWACDEATCRRVVRLLIEAGALRQMRDGRIIRAE